MPLDDDHRLSPGVLLEALLPRPKSAFRLLIQRDSDVTLGDNSSDPIREPNEFTAQDYIAACRENVRVRSFFSVVLALMRRMHLLDYLFYEIGISERT